MNAHRLRPAVIVLAAVALSAVLTGCQGDDSAAGADGTPSTPATASSAPGTSGGKGGATAGSGSSGGSGATAAASSGGASSGGAAGGTPVSKAPGTAKTTAPAAGCASKAPDPDHVDPDEIAVYRVEELPSSGTLNLIIQHGAWGCPGKDSDGTPFVVTGEESRWALDQAAYVTATNPIVSSSKNQRIGVGELIDWIKAHPNSGLVFKYETGDDGAIHSLQQVYTP